MMIFKSRYTPGLIDGRDCDFVKGESVVYMDRSGKLVRIIIDSEIMKHDEAPGDGTGYESIFADTGQRAFASRYGIIGWAGKC